MKLNKRMSIILTLISLFLLGLVTTVTAKVDYSTKTGKSCDFCHYPNPPDLSEAGKYYKEHNYSLEGYTIVAPTTVAPKISIKQPWRHFGENCENCHTDKLAEWKASKHAVAYTDPSFQEAISKVSEDVRKDCIKCHTTIIDGTLVESVTCAACHRNATTVKITEPAQICRGCHSEIQKATIAMSRGAATARVSNEFERWSFAKHSNATGRLLASLEFRALETPAQKMMCLSCHSTDFELLNGELKINDGNIGCVACHGGINPKEEIKNVEEGKFPDYAAARRNSIKKVNHNFAVPQEPDFCGNCHTGYHHPQAVVWKTGEHSHLKCVKCHGESISKETHELDMDHTFMVNFQICGECHDPTTRINKWRMLKDSEEVALKSFNEAQGKLDVALKLGISKVYVGVAQKKLNEARDHLGRARNAYFHDQKQMKVGLSNATALSEDAKNILENAILEYQRTTKTIGIVTTFLIAAAVAIIFTLISLWRTNHRLILPVKRVAQNILNIRRLPPREKKIYTIGVIVIIAILIAPNVGFSLYSEKPSFCSNCHIMKPMFDSWRNSPHKNINCHTCHRETMMSSALKGLNYGAAVVYGRYAATGIPQVPKAICKECHNITTVKPPRLIPKDAHMLHPTYFDCNTCHRTHLVSVEKETCESCHVPGYTRVVKPI